MFFDEFFKYYKEYFAQKSKDLEAEKQATIEALKKDYDEKTVKIQAEATELQVKATEIQKSFNEKIASFVSDKETLKADYEEKNKALSDAMTVFKNDAETILNKVKSDADKVAQDAADRVKQEADAEVERLAREYGGRATAEETAHKEQIAAEEKSHKEQIEAVKKEYSERATAEETAHKEQIAAEKKSHKEQIEAVKKEYSERAAAEETAHKEQIAAVKKEYSERATVEETAHKEQIAAVKKDYDDRLAAEKAAHKEQLESIKKGYEENQQKQQEAFKRKADEMEHDYSEYRKGVATREEFKQVKGELDGKFAEMDKLAEEVKSSDVVSVNKKVNGLQKKIKGWINPAVPLVIAILALLLSAGLVAMMALDINPFKKPEATVAEPTTTVEQVAETPAETVVEVSNPCASGHQYVVIGETEPVLAEDGKTTVVTRTSICTVCKDVMVEEIASHAHTYESDTTGMVTVAPTLTEAGVRSYRCDGEGCDVCKTEEMPALLYGMTLATGSENALASALADLLPNAIALDPGVVKTDLSAEYAFNPETMLWFVNDAGEGILAISMAKGQKIKDEAKRLDNLAGVNGNYYQTEKYIFVQVAGVEPFAYLRGQLGIADKPLTVLESLGEAKAIGNAVATPKA